MRLTRIKTIRPETGSYIVVEGKYDFPSQIALVKTLRTTLKSAVRPVYADELFELLSSPLAKAIAESGKPDTYRSGSYVAHIKEGQVYRDVEITDSFTCGADNQYTIVMDPSIIRLTDAAKKTGGDGVIFFQGVTPVVNCNSITLSSEGSESPSAKFIENVLKCGDSLTYPVQFYMAREGIIGSEACLPLKASEKEFIEAKESGKPAIAKCLGYDGDRNRVLPVTFKLSPKPIFDLANSLPNDLAGVILYDPSVKPEQIMSGI